MMACPAALLLLVLSFVGQARSNEDGVGACESIFPHHTPAKAQAYFQGLRERDDFSRFCTAGKDQTEPPARPWVPCDQLDRVAGKEGFLIITTFNCAYVQFAMNFWLHHQKLGISNIIFIAEDCKAYQNMLPHVGADRLALSFFGSKSIEEASKFGTTEFKALVETRPLYLSFFLDAGYEVMYMDVDAVPLRNIAEAIRGPLSGDHELYYILDNTNWPVSQTIGRANPEPEGSMCTCFFYLRPVVNVKRVIFNWFDMTKSTEEDQAAFNKMLNDERMSGDLRRTDRYELSRTQFINGMRYEALMRAIHAGPSDANYVADENLWPVWFHANWNVGRDEKFMSMLTYGHFMYGDLTYTTAEEKFCFWKDWSAAKTFNAGYRRWD